MNSNSVSHKQKDEAAQSGENALLSAEEQINLLEMADMLQEAVSSTNIDYLLMGIKFWEEQERKALATMRVIEGTKNLIEKETLMASHQQRLAAIRFNKSLIERIIAYNA